MIQTIYLTNTESTRTPVTHMKTLSFTYGTANNTSTGVSSAANGTYQMIPGTAANGTSISIPNNAVTSNGWQFESQLPGRYWPGTWTFQAALLNNFTLGGLGGQKITLFANMYVVTPGSTTVSQPGQNNSFLLLGSATSPTAGSTTNFTATLTLNNFLILYPNQYLYIEVYITQTNAFLNLTSFITLDSPNTFITTTFFEEEMQSKENNAKLLGLY